MIKENDYKALYEVIVSLESVEECKDFLDDLLSKHELDSLASRIKSATLLMEGKTYLQTIAETKISSATLARISKCVKYGKGYARVLGKRKKN